ncbi:hypothetical protein ACHAXA_007401 [Cyclostephanos tholiformis]|uniref:RING-type domain-containing protein n=1 Tax=Cyclostephanos tholiformis TaxID=382380 RepID=A0ABD3RHS9_9STRA
MARAAATTATSKDDDDDDEDSTVPSCPVCLISSNDFRDGDDDDAGGKTHDDDVVPTTFVRTPCDHVFCRSCMERVLLRRPTGRMGDRRVVPTLGPCPMCREVVSLFDLRPAEESATTTTENGGPSSFVYGDESDASSWPVANCRYRQRVLLPIQDPNSTPWALIGRKGPIEGHGIEFRFHDPAPSFRIVDEDDDDDDDDEDGEGGGGGQHDKDRRSAIVFDEYHFDEYHFHRGSMTFTGRVTFEDRPMRGKLDGRRYNALACTLNFSDDGRYIRVGDLNWRYRPRVDDNDVENVRIDGMYRWRSVEVDVGALVYQRYEAGDSPPGRDVRPSSGPRYRPDAIWGNTFCQGLCVGMASYHFLEGDDDDDGGGGGSGGYRAYISYESPRTTMWPPLDNGDTVPPRVHFRNIRWEDDTRTFRGDICWEIDYGTTWMNESKWSYEMRFDPTYAFVESGTVVRSMGEPPHRFGIDLIYINAALETPLREVLQRGARTGDYLDMVRRWRDCNASSATLDMLGEVAMNVMDERGSMIDFNL